MLQSSSKLYKQLFNTIFDHGCAYIIDSVLLRSVKPKVHLDGTDKHKDIKKTTHDPSVSVEVVLYSQLPQNNVQLS